MVGSELLYFLQLDGYHYNYVFKYFGRKFKENVLNIFMNIVIIITMYIVDFQSIYLCLIYIIFVCCIWVWAGNQFEHFIKIKYTKRMIRIGVLYFALIIVSYIILIQYNLYYITIFFPLYFALCYLLIFMSLIILSPIEKLIGRHYLNKARRKISSISKLTKIGITGSYGKTSTKEILGSILSREYYTLLTPKSYNTPFGISKTINSDLQNSHEIFVCEMGAKKRGEILELCKLVNVDAGIVTSVGRQHLNTFGSIKNIYLTKKELPDFLFNKLCIFNLMNLYVAQMYKEYSSYKTGVFILFKRNLGRSKYLLKNTHSVKPNSAIRKIILHEFVKQNNVYAKNISVGASVSSFDIWYGDTFVVRAHTQLLGEHNIINILLAVAMALRLNVSAKNIEIGISQVKSIDARLERRVNKNGAIIINNGYNSNIDSAPYALKCLRLFDMPNKVVITPGLVECKDDFECNFKLGKFIARECTEVIIVKRHNRNALLEGLKSAGFNMNKVHLVDEFSEVLGVINNATNDYVFLIENDLPDNYS